MRYIQKKSLRVLHKYIYKCLYPQLLNSSINFIELFFSVYLKVSIDYFFEIQTQLNYLYPKIGSNQHVLNLMSGFDDIRDLQETRLTWCRWRIEGGLGQLRRQIH